MRPPSLSPFCSAGPYTHEVHLPQRKTGVADKPTHAHFAAEDYAHAPALRQAQQQQLGARAPPPFAADERGLVAAAGPARFLQPHAPQQPSDKVGTTSFGADTYSTSLQATAAARQQRFMAAAEAQAPFAVSRGDGGAAEAAAVPIHYEKPQQKDPSVKVGGVSPGQMVAVRQAACTTQMQLAPPLCQCHQALPAPQVTEQQLASRDTVEAGCRQRMAEQQAARQKNWGSFVIG